MCISRNTKSPRNMTTNIDFLSGSCIAAASDENKATNTGAADGPASHTEHTDRCFISTLNDHEQAPKRQCRRNLRDRINSSKYLYSKARHVFSHAKDILDEIDAEDEMTTRQQNNQENEENNIVQTAHATQTSTICWAGKKESHFFAFGYLLSGDDEEESDDE